MTAVHLLSMSDPESLLAYLLARPVSSWADECEDDVHTGEVVPITPIAMVELHYIRGPWDGRRDRLQLPAYAVGREITNTVGTWHYVCRRWSSMVGEMIAEPNK